ncbi:hypothetical protein PsorP6_003697 [Peronosclerospora sorghi]|uniref:Uncharacterized protein n=1 Tax=Peronosclerospora sorghi TaxID=230839 RepID=A0ACC0VQ07_9STRA|nr:hypothetical protein PsorP6_003697 [Peronosclerospora sorghi]
MPPPSPQCDGVPSSLLDLYVDGCKLDISSYVPAFPAIIRARVRGGLRGGKGGFGAMLRSMGKATGAKITSDFGACRDLHGRRLRHVNQEVAILKWRQDEGARSKLERESVEDREFLDEETPSGIPGWYLATPSWAEGVKKSHMKRRHNTVMCRNWLKAREDGRSAPAGAPRWWGCPRGRNCDFAHGEEELRGQGLTEIKRAKREEEHKLKQQEMQDYVDFEQDIPNDVLDAIRSGLRQPKAKTKAKNRQQQDTPEFPHDATEHIRIRSIKRPMPMVEKWLKVVGKGSEQDVTVSVQTTFKHGLCELRGRGNFGTIAAQHCCALTEGKWYYEVRLITAGVAQIGWADYTFEADSASGDGVGDHERSWSYDGARQVKWNSGKDEEYATDGSWNENDVIGCFLDLHEGIISFTRNGVDLGVAFRNVKTTSGDQGFFPAISVEQMEILLINIGAQPFMYKAPGFEAVVDALNTGATDKSASIVTNTSTTVASRSNVTNNCASSHLNSIQCKRSLLSNPEISTANELKKTTTFAEPRIDLMKYETVESLKSLGLGRLKQELSCRDLKCGYCTWLLIIVVLFI